jgi:hypothetical protein
MAFWNRRTDSELPTSQVEYQETTERRWPTLVGYMLLALLVATFVVLGGKWVYNRFADSADETPKPVSIDSERKKAANEDKKTTKEDSSSSSTKSQGESSENDNKSTSPTPSSLPNNGPGEVIALFVGTSLAAAGLHYIVSLRRFNSAN